MATALGMQPIQVAVECIFGQELEIDLQNIRQGGGANPIGSGQFAGRVNQAIERHGAGQLPDALTEAGLGEDRVQAQTLPKLITGVDGAGLARFLGAHLIDMDGQQVGVGGSRVSRVGRQRRWSGGLHFWRGDPATRCRARECRGGRLGRTKRRRVCVPRRATRHGDEGGGRRGSR